jgi:hypothetical protein
MNKEWFFAVTGTYKGRVYPININTVRRIPTFDGENKVRINIDEFNLAVLKMRAAELYQEILKKHC